MDGAKADGEADAAMQPCRELDKLLVRMRRAEKLHLEAGRHYVIQNSGRIKLLGFKLHLVRFFGGLLRGLDRGLIVFGADGRLGVRVEGGIDIGLVLSSVWRIWPIFWAPCFDAWTSKP